jgi:hypothetical protein
MLMDQMSNASPHDNLTEDISVHFKKISKEKIEIISYKTLNLSPFDKAN